MNVVIWLQPKSKTMSALLPYSGIKVSTLGFNIEHMWGTKTFGFKQELQDTVLGLIGFAY